ncbi:MAG: hypothetical protein PVH89_02400 [Gammaproteobacteria bacterium]|jgi:hypothetical protein
MVKTPLGLALALFCGQVLAQASDDTTPRLANGVPDLNGTWDNGSGIDFIQPVIEGQSICLAGCSAPAAEIPDAEPLPPDRPRYRPEHQARVDELDALQVRLDPVLRCFAPGVPRIGPPDKIVQQATEIVFLYDDVSGNFFRIVPLDATEHPTDTVASYLGDAIGRWEGDTLVVETVNFNGETWLTDDGSFHTPDLRVVERISRQGDTLTWQATAYDPAVLAEPWRVRPRTAYLTDIEVTEAPPCIERDLDHMVDDSSHDNPR